MGLWSGVQTGFCSPVSPLVSFNRGYAGEIKKHSQHRAYIYIYIYTVVVNTAPTQTERKSDNGF